MSGVLAGPDGRAAISGDDVAVIIVNYNAAAFLPRCLDALSQQTVAPGTVLVVDNGSEDGSAQAVCRRYPAVQLHELGVNAGFAAANNAGIARVPEARWVALLNPDAFPAPTWLETLLTAARVHSEFVCFGCRMLDAGDPALLDGAGDTYHSSGLAWRNGHGAAADALSEQDAEIFAPCAAAALYRRDALLGVGGFDESFFCYFEDIDLGFRMRLAGYRCLYVGAALVHHVGSGVSGRNSDFAVYHGHRNLVWTFVKDMPAPLLWYYLPQHLLINVVALGYYSARGQAGVIWRAKRDAVRGLPAALRQRPRIQRARRVTAAAIRAQMARGLGTLYGKFRG